MIVVTDAQQRALVRLPDGRTARLVSLTGRGRATKPTARVQLPSGAYLTVPTERLVLA